VLVVVAGCSVPPPTFLCGEWEDCGPGGACEPGTNACSFTDESCPSGRRFSELAADPFREQCVEVLPEAPAGGLCETSDTCAMFRTCLGNRCVSADAISLGSKLGCAHCAFSNSIGAPLWCWGESTLTGPLPPQFVPFAGHSCPDPGFCFPECSTCPDPPMCEASCSGSNVSTNVAVGGNHLCYFNGRTYCIGDNQTLQVGSPVAAQLGQARIDAPFPLLAAGAQHTCGRPIDNTRVFCWGDNTEGELDGVPGPPSAAPLGRTPFPPAQPGGTLIGVDFIAVGNNFTCAASNEEVDCWGATPIEAGRVPALVGDQITALDLGLNHGCVIKGGRVSCWGGNRQGQAAPGVATTTVGAFRVMPDVEFTAVVTGRIHTCAIDLAGAIWCWGDGTEGQLGGAVGPGPVRVIADPPAVGPIAAGADVTCALHADDRVRCFGDVLETGGERYDSFFVCASDL
jgi:hypothetical protein